MVDLSKMIVACLFVLGAAMGSFSLALAYRLRKKLDWVKGRSVCEHCGHQLAVKDLVPIVSWLALGGRCRYCRKPISPQLILAEFGLAIVFAASYVFWPATLHLLSSVFLFSLWLLICTLFSTLFWYDLNWMILPNKLVYPLVLLAATDYGLRDGSFDIGNLALLGASIAIASGTFLFFYVVSKGKWIGFGDVRLGVALGLLASRPEYAALTVFGASFIGTFVVLPVVYVIRRKVVAKLPFGPLLIVAAIIVRLFGEQIFDWYLSVTGL